MEMDSSLEAAFRNNPGQAFALEDVEAIDKAWDNSDVVDEPSYIWLVRLKDGRYAVASGGHDYTGWDCQSSLETSVWLTHDEAIRWGMTLNDREDLGLLLPDDKPQGEN